MAEPAAEFALSDAPLQGWNLIEANAGTGKTFSITGLYLRLLMERALEPEEILVVTFTRVATGELKARLLARLGEAGAALAGRAEPDPALAAIIARLDDPGAARRRVQRAIRAFDLAQVHTIHGFCQQLLAEFSFALGFDPERELIEDESSIVDPLLRRAWREASAAFSPGFAAYLAGRRDLEPTAMSAAVRCLLDKPYAALAGPEPVSLAPLETAFEARRKDLAPRWRRRGGEALAALRAHPGLNRRRYQPEQIDAQGEALAALLADPWRNLKQTGTAARLGSAALREGTRVGFEPPADPLFAAVEHYLAALEALEAGYRATARGLPLELHRQVREALAGWKRRHSVLTYRDLIMDLDEALKGPSAAAIRDAVAARYRAVLVDEFQDTDPVQFGIFRTLFDDRGTVFLVGDPKQSLYAFRGADVFAYLGARAVAARGYRLTRDWRASPALLAAVNRLFSARECPFALAAIEFHPSLAADRPVEHLELGGRAAAPLVAWELPGGLSKPSMRNAAAAAVAAGIESLLAPEAGARIVTDSGPARALTAADIAVVVRRHDQAAEVAGALNRIGIACVQPGVLSVFGTDEAEELERVLHGVCLAELPGRLAGALTTRMLGEGAELAWTLHGDDDKFERWLERFQQYRSLWEEQGITALVTALVRDFAVPARWLPRVDGHRRLTNLYHLVELMERHLDDQVVTPGEQLEWLRRRRQSTEFPGEDALLRLESDADLVTILTIHKSKGLEYPVVLCPYLWDERPAVAAPAWIEHHGAPGQGLTIDFGSGAFAHERSRHADEEFAENMRLCYVALSRARARCCFVWGVGPGTGASPLAYLLAPPGQTREAVAAAYRGKSTWPKRRAATRARLGELEIAVEPPPSRRAGTRAGNGEARFGRYRSAPAEIPAGRSIHSYSSLAGTGWEEAPDYDAVIGPAASDPRSVASAGIHDLPAGARTGLMVHELLEELDDFGDTAPELVARAVSKLEKFGFRSGEYGRRLGEHLHRCLRTPLLEGDPDLMLARIGASEAIREMEFHFALGRTRIEALWRLVRGSAPEAAPGSIEGFVRGFIDLVFRFKDKFYLVDYKTNYLGEDTEAYAPERLSEAVLAHAYDLQYHLYALALGRYLERRIAGFDYESHFGGVLYLFLRGMDPGHGPARGVFHARPSAATMTALERLLGAPPAAPARP